MVNQPKLLYTFRADNSINLGTLDYVPPGVPTVPYYAKSDITGSDSMGNGKTQLQTALNSTVNWQYANIIVTPDDVGSPATLADFAAVYTKTISANDMPGGKGNKFTLTQLKRSSAKWADTSRPQSLIFTTRTQNNPLNTLYVRKKITIPSNMIAVLSGSASIGWCETDAIKCSHDIGNTVDLRYSNQVFKKQGESGLRFMAQIDRGTGGSPVSATYPKLSAEGSCIPGDTYLMEYFIKRPATGGASNLTDGLYQVVYTNLRTNERFEVCNEVGGIHWGVNNGQFSLFYHYLSYTGGFDAPNPFVLEFSDLEYWDMPPNALILSNKTTVDALA